MRLQIFSMEEYESQSQSQKWVHNPFLNLIVVVA